MNILLAICRFLVEICYYFIVFYNYFDVKEANFFFALFGSKFDASMKAL